MVMSKKQEIFRKSDVGKGLSSFFLKYLAYLNLDRASYQLYLPPPHYKLCWVLKIPLELIKTK